ncbi:YheT family hydrolase [Anatilimnocola floriformis]|uniref:YheT family hydrolase n=1 Tax=Anatilimnocola floriformis TaxID=2948575 RepID=UPI0020C3F608|nr:alpha/beta fold hydrolase [Anatilimnocola floriformis]
MDVHFPSFRPHPWVRGGHLQTILGCYFFHQTITYTATQHRVTLDDGDAIVVHDDRPQKWQPNDPVALLVHGLGGSHQSGYMQRCAKKLNAHGVRVFRMDLRGCGAGIGLARQLCHAGRSDDVAAVLNDINVRCLNSPTAVIGFSMGANMVLKLAGEWADQAPDNVVGVMAVAPPVDLGVTCLNVQKVLRGMYDRSFVTGLRRYIANRERNTPDCTPVPLPASLRGIRDFDACVTAPLSGFADADDYYSQASSGPYLRKIRIPTLIVAAKDDPIVPIDCLQQSQISDAVKLIIADGGGHLGYVAARSKDPDCRWLDWRVVDWTLAHMPGPLVAANWRLTRPNLNTLPGVQHSV